MKRWFSVIGVMGGLLVAIILLYYFSADFFRERLYRGNVIDFGIMADKVFRLYASNDLRFVPETKSFIGSGGGFTLVKIGQKEELGELVFGYRLNGRRIFFKVAVSPCNLRTKKVQELPALEVEKIYQVTFVGIQNSQAGAAERDADYPACQGIWRRLRSTSAENVTAFFSTGKGFSRPWEPVVDLTWVVLAASVKSL